MIPVLPTTEYTIPIYPDPKDGKKPARIVFISAEVKALYVSEEGSFCKQEYTKYAGAIGIQARGKAFQALSMKRVAFARKKGYAPLKTNIAVWKFAQPNAK